MSSQGICPLNIQNTSIYGLNNCTTNFVFWQKLHNNWSLMGEKQLIFDERKKEKENHWHPKSTMALKTNNVN